MNDLQFDALNSRIDLLAQQVSILVDRQKKRDELIDELVLPVAKEVMKSATQTLDTLEKENVFEFARELGQVGKKIVRSYSADDVRLLGESIVKILDAVRSLTQPEVMTIASEAGNVLKHADASKPIGLLGVVKSTRDDDVGRGMGVVVDLLRRVGQAADRKSKIAALVAPKLRGRTTPHQVKLQPIQSETLQPWTRPLGEKVALTEGVTLTDLHWSVIEFARSDFEQMKASPNIRRITQGMGIQTKALYGLFPKAPARTIAKIAGLPKPAGCL